ncbi:site-specific integrase [Oceanimonas marisflavi]|uniref:hypothetical protein n=1 Tax=Oceanimonas marisflavi TaxID=2059724 RepID=UPI000D305259|nr:hypothetical protein [Oceanimonas marisflavi]
MNFEQARFQLELKKKFTDRELMNLLDKAIKENKSITKSAGKLRLVIKPSGSIYIAFYREYGRVGDLFKDFKTYSEALDHAARIMSRDITNVTVYYVIESYINSLMKRLRKKDESLPFVIDNLADGEGYRVSSFKTELGRAKTIKLAFDECQVFGKVKIRDIVSACEYLLYEYVKPTGDVLSRSYVKQVMECLKRVWAHGAMLYNDDIDCAANLHKHPVFKDIKSNKPCKVYTDNKGMAKLWIRIAKKTPMQKNAVRFMILTGVRPINVSNLRWSSVSDKMIKYYEGDMKSKSIFIIPITPEIREILEEQRGVNPVYVFSGVRNTNLPMNKRSLDKLFKDNFDNEHIYSQGKDIGKKGSAGAFPTLCRKLVKTNVIEQLREFRPDYERVSKICMNHSVGDSLSKHYDFSDVLEPAIAGFNAHYKVLHEEIKALEEEGYR